MKKCTNDHKRKAIIFMNKLSANTIAIGDSYNDLNMLKEARFGILFKSTKKIILENKKFYTCNTYNALLSVINKKSREWNNEYAK